MAVSNFPTETESQAIESTFTKNDELTKDEIFYLLKNRRRRDIVNYLMDNDGTATLGELAEQIAAWENEIEVTALSSGQRKRVYVALYQTHLPKLDENGIIEYDQNRGNVELSENAERLKVYLNDESTSDDPWNRRYAALSIIGAASTLAILLGFRPGGISPTQFTLVLIGAFLVASIVHTYDHRRHQA